MDKISQQARSEIMSHVRSSGNKTTELAMIKVFKANGVKGWRRKYPIFGKPDFVFPKQRLAIFVDGCFWHGHPDRKDLIGIHPILNISYSELYQKTLDKIEYFKENGYNVIYKWGR